MDRLWTALDCPGLAPLSVLLLFGNFIKVYLVNLYVRTGTIVM